LTVKQTFGNRELTLQTIVTRCVFWVHGASLTRWYCFAVDVWRTDLNTDLSGSYKGTVSYVSPAGGLTCIWSSGGGIDLNIELWVGLVLDLFLLRLGEHFPKMVIRVVVCVRW